MRFNEHLQEWARLGRYPAIHDAMFEAVAENASGRRFLDLCCCHGLLGQRVKRQWPRAHVVGVEGNSAYVETARAAGVDVWIERLTVNHATLADLVFLMARELPDVLLARRCFPELFGHDLEFGGMFLQAVRGAGIGEVSLQWRPRGSSRPVRALASGARRQQSCASQDGRGGQLP